MIDGRRGRQLPRATVEAESTDVFEEPGAVEAEQAVIDDQLRAEPQALAGVPAVRTARRATSGRGGLGGRS